MMCVDLDTARLPGLTARALSLADASSVTDLMAQAQMNDIGEVVIEEADVVGDWQRPSFDIASQTVGVFEGDRLVAYGEVHQGRWADACVHPQYRGRGIGTALVEWLQGQARRDGGTLVGMPVPAGTGGEDLLRAHGFETLWTSWVLQLPHDCAVESRPLPPGYTIREATAADYEAAYHVVEDAFLEWSDRAKDPYDDWAAKVTRRPGFAPWQLRLACSPTGEVVAVCFVVLADECGFVDKLAVRVDQRGRGLAAALLADSFATARAHGATRSELSTDSRTGALGLYERVGMVVTSRWHHLAKTL
jgi:GNAT superfamily N-acetyltransferase